ncbi:MAG: UbiH/UbiF/VisC/COQ6 family ubiquinone biosynthesis hydroxylase [Pseudomonadota bacterium]
MKTNQTKNFQIIRCDLLIVGGGLVGSTLAIALGNLGLNIIILDHVAPACKIDSKDLRTTAISYGSSNLFKALNLWAQLEPYTQPILDICVSEYNSPAILHYTCQDVAENAPMGHMIDNGVLRHTLQNHTHVCKNIRWLAPAILKKLELTTSHIKAHLEDGREIRANLCIGADGRNSKVRSLTDLPVTQWSYPQSALICTVTHKKPHNGVAHERFLESGPFAVLPMPGNASGIVWSCPHHQAAHLGKLEDREIMGCLQQECGDTLGALTHVTPRQVYPLSVLFARRFVDKRVALIGDAAHVMHPIAGQGLNVGLRDVAALAEVIHDTHRLGLDIGNDMTLEKYQRWRRFDVLSFISMTDGLVRAFSYRSPIIRSIRRIGMRVINNTQPLKRALTRHAMGISGNKPKLLEAKSIKSQWH